MNRRGAPRDSALDVAWRTAAAALPDGKHLQPEFALTVEGRWRVEERHAFEDRWPQGFGDSPAEALLDLIDRLASKKESS
jgi:hypothetical protein